MHSRTEVSMVAVRALALSLLVWPALASAQGFGPPPPGFIRGRIHWHMRRHVPPVFYAPPPVWVQPPVVIQPPPVVVEPPPAYYPPPAPPPAPPAVAAPVIVAAPPPPPHWRARFGLGATVEGVYTSAQTRADGYGVLGQLRYRSGRHSALELTAGYERANRTDGLSRTDVPVSFGLIIPILGPEHAFTPYLVGAAGLNFADLRLVDTPNLTLDDRRVQALAQIGGGLELRLGQHVALHADARLEGRWTLGAPSPEVAAATVKIDGAVAPLLADTVGVRLGVGGTLYF